MENTIYKILMENTIYKILMGNTIYKILMENTIIKIEWKTDKPLTPPHNPDLFPDPPFLVPG